MSDDTSGNDVRSQEWDPLTAPVWEISDENDVLLAPDVEEFMPTAADTIIRRRPLLPPDADEIIRGEYTGWVPLIKPGETLAEAKAREEKLALYSNPVGEKSSDVSFARDSWVPVEVKSSDLSDFVAPANLVSDTANIVRDPIVEVRPYVFPTEIVADPDFVVSPTEALEEARRRIAQMRASLQTNINRVSQSFEHPIFTPPADVPVEVSVQQEPPVVPIVEQQHEPQSFESLFETETESDVVGFTESPEPIFVRPTSVHEPDLQPESVKTQVREEPQVYTQSTQQASPTVIIDEAADQRHSLELVIMRDEIKDLRDRLDSSQKLIENLMVRLADLAELALKRRD